MTLEDPEMLYNKRSADRGIVPIDAQYVHYSPPRLLDARKWARGGDVERLREAALGGHAHRLLGLAAPGVKARTFLRDLPKLIAKCEALHLAATEGSLQEIKDVLEKDPMRKRLAMCRDRAGVGLLHKAVYYDYMDIIDYFLENYPQTVHMRDSEGRTPLHYAAVCKEAQEVSDKLIAAGGERHAMDSRQRQPSYYMTRPTALHLPEPPPPTPQQTELVIKPSNIRIWCHDRDLGRLQQVVWKGQGSRLRTEVSNQPAVKRFLEAVPHIMGTIKEIHSAVIHNDYDRVKSLTEDPIPPIILSSQDLNGLTALHKAAGLGHYDIAEHLVNRYPEGTQITDNDGRTPLHWSILAKDNDKIYNILVEKGAKESALDIKLKSGAFYKNRPNDLDKSLLNVVPDAPRVASPTYPSSWDWELLNTNSQTIVSNLHAKPKRQIEKVTLKNAESIENVRSISENNHEELRRQNPPESEAPELPAEESQEPEPEPELEPEPEPVEDRDNVEPGYDAEAEDELNEDGNINGTNDDENHNDDEAESIGEATKSPTPIIPTVDDTSNKPKSAHSTHESLQSPDHALISNSTPSASPELDNIHNGDVSRPSSAVSRKSSAISKRSLSAKSRAPSVIENNDEEVNGNHIDEENEINDTELADKENENEDIADTIDNGNIEEEDVNNSEDRDENDVENNNNINEDEDIENTLKERSNQIEDDESVSQSDEKSDESEFKGPQIQDVDDEKGDEPDYDGNGLKRMESRNSEDGKVESRPQSQISRKRSSAKSRSLHSRIGENLDLERNANTGHSQGNESTIEGVINGDAEVDSLDADQRIPGSTPDEGDVNIEDTEVQTLIEAGNMEQLASLVLNGEGERLVGHMARNPELQAFLDNVPSYMNKIKRVHLSARDGNIRELQAALDRRKFAIARDQISPNGATPLHVAVLFGHTPIVRYLAGRFPETLSAVDFEGRTALHYAAVLKDNNHYYNILLNMGANPKDQDDNGYTPDDYQRNENHLTHQQLLKSFGAEENIVDEMLSDKVANDTVSSRRELTDQDMLSVLWRCFRLLQDHRRPSKVGAPPSASSNQGSPTTFLGRFLTRNVFEKIKGRITKLDHNLFDVIWPAVKKLPNDKNAVEAVEEDFNGGIVAPDYYAYAVFEEFTMPLIKDLHCINMFSDLQNQPDSIFLPLSNKRAESSKDVQLHPMDIHLDLDPHAKHILAGTIECSRNLQEYELPLNMNVGQLEIVERNLNNIFVSDDFAEVVKIVNSDSNKIEKCGTYYTMNEVLDTPSEIRAILAASGLLIPLCDIKGLDDDKRLHGKHWPYGRGVFLTNDGSIAIWLNVQDHIRVLSCTSHHHPAEIGRSYSLISRVMMHLDDHLKYKRDEKLGYLSARPSFLGNSLHFTFTINLPYLSKEPDNLKHLCTVRGLHHKETHTQDIVRIGNYQSLGVTELQSFHDFTTAVGNILQLEKDLAMQNSLHIAEMFVNIFKRKRSNLVDTNM